MTVRSRSTVGFVGRTVIIVDVGGFFGPKKIIMSICRPVKVYDSAKYMYTNSKKTMLLTIKGRKSTYSEHQ